ncbi:MAG: hypothetical protein KME23_12975 [Goleter apudmare HA4340-LM2]|nr:hypothetical protein [Goleter apudmare HA4340-LM2]
MKISSFNSVLKEWCIMLGWIFGDLVKKLERSAKVVAGDFLEASSKEISNLFDQQLYPLADKLDYIAEQRIKQVETLESQVTNDIESLLNSVDDKLRLNLKKIDEIRESAIKDVRETGGELDFYLENRINQFSLTVMKVLSQAEGIANVIIDDIKILEEKLFQDINYIVDKIIESIEGTAELIRQEFQKYVAHFLPNPFDKCRQRLNIGMKPGSRLSDIELYELIECHELSKLHENTPIEEVLKSYGQMQLNAARMAALVRRSPELKRRAFEDWLKYGLLCEFWRKTRKIYDASETLRLQHQPTQQFLIDK